jgi:hypothetical protein
MLFVFVFVKKKLLSFSQLINYKASKGNFDYIVNIRSTQKFWAVDVKKFSHFVCFLEFVFVFGI